MTWLRNLFQLSRTAGSVSTVELPEEFKALVALQKEEDERAWWKDMRSLIGKTDEQFLIVKPQCEDRRLLGQRLKEWQQANAYVRHIWGLDDLLEGREPRTPPEYACVPFPGDRWAESYEAVALIYVAAGTNHKAAGEALVHALGEELIRRLVWFTDIDGYRRWNA